MKQTETMDKLFLELSQFTQAKTERECRLEIEIASLMAKLKLLEADQNAKVSK